MSNLKSLNDPLFMDVNSEEMKKIYGGDWSVASGTTTIGVGTRSRPTKGDSHGDQDGDKD